MLFDGNNGFITVSYLATGLTLLGVLLWVVLDGKAQRRKMEALEAQGVRRRSRKAD